MAGGILTQVEQVHVSFLRWTDPVSVRMRRDLDSALTDYSNAVRELEEVLKCFQQSPGADALEELKRNRNDYKDLVTESPYPISMPDQRITQEARIHTKLGHTCDIFRCSYPIIKAKVKSDMSSSTEPLVETQAPTLRDTVK